MKNRKPFNAFMLYVKKKREDVDNELIKEYPHANIINVTSTLKYVSVRKIDPVTGKTSYWNTTMELCYRWGRMSENEKSIYKKKAHKLMKNHIPKFDD